MFASGEATALTGVRVLAASGDGSVRLLQMSSPAFRVIIETALPGHNLSRILVTGKDSSWPIGVEGADRLWRLLKVKGAALPISLP